MDPIVYLGLGTNLGNREKNLNAAVDALSPKVEILARSPVYRTEPWGYTDQADFLNQVIKGSTSLSPTDLLAFAKQVEEQVGRKATFRWGPREIDIDILFYDDLVLETTELTIPHPRLHERAFMLVPLADIAPELVHPKLGETAASLLEKTGREGVFPI
jgi:2-amino-4-hydroxy-6-hydroxymethyldihydropteridine diphosphokinase